MRTPLWLGFLLCAFPLAALGRDCVPSDELWSKPRNAAVVLADPAIRECVLPFLQSGQARLTLRHAPDEEAQLRAADLRWWLIALGLEPDRIALAEATKATDPLVLELTEPK
ncbi:hypothetical protein EDC61_10584 [Sulfuritortus calidifontis]|uniref:Uncharacterized protein n=1 Tax=Sulfuritortus calidifontis TaxID=1914471 RepID=A0A4R3JYH4_9PROT|nr:hypothetical protein [Sulfuritortus calidifontis]TCS72430.1 hypothetical protein EDC61_10584 [Sulfuritortus calidifontis]